MNCISRLHSKDIKLLRIRVYSYPTGVRVVHVTHVFLIMSSNFCEKCLQFVVLTCPPLEYDKCMS